jgi:hypothetical protein
MMVDLRDPLKGQTRGLKIAPTPKKNWKFPALLLK